MELFVNISGEKKNYTGIKLESLTLGKNIKKCSAEEDSLT
jgi:hypothetical protein